MGRVQIACFLDPQEAHIAAGALRSAGIEASLQDSALARVDPLMIQALGGVPLFVAAHEAAAARKLLDNLKPADPEALDWVNHPEALKGIPLAFTAMDPGAAMAVKGARDRPTLLRKTVAAIWILAIALLVASIVLSRAGGQTAPTVQQSSG